MQSVIHGMLQEEKQRNLEMQAAYRQEINGLRKGSIKKKVISGCSYYYLKYRQEGQVKDIYLGKDESIINEIRREIEKRKYLQSVLKRLEQEHKEISKIIKD